MILDKLRVRISKMLITPINTIFNWVLLRINQVEYASTVRISGRLRVRNRGQLRIGESVIITSDFDNNPVGGGSVTALYVSPGGRIEIGAGSSLSNVIIFCQEKIEIGKEVMLGGGVQVYDSNFHSTRYIYRVSRPDPDIVTKPVMIEDGAFIGTGSLIMKGVTIGSKSVIAAGSVVVTPVPSNEIWGGNPAKFIKKIDV